MGISHNGKKYAIPPTPERLMLGKRGIESVHNLSKLGDRGRIIKCVDDIKLYRMVKTGSLQFAKRTTKQLMRFNASLKQYTLFHDKQCKGNKKIDPFHIKMCWKRK